MVFKRRENKLTFINLPIIKGSKFNHYWDLKYKETFKFEKDFTLSFVAPCSISHICGLIIVIAVDQANRFQPIYIGGIIDKLDYNTNEFEYWE